MYRHLIMAYNYFHKVISAYCFRFIFTVVHLELYAPAILNSFNVILLNSFCLYTFGYSISLFL